MKSKSLIHVGYHKTGTTFLQKRIFEGFPNVFYRVKQTSIRDNIIYPTPLHFDCELARKFCQNEMVKSDAIYTVFSNEYLSANPHGLDFHSKYVAERLKDCLPNSKVLIVIREQKSMIFSSYAQHIRARRGSYGIHDYLFSPVTKQFRLDHLRYHLLIEHYFNLFEKENVLVLPYELLKQEPLAFLMSIFRFLDLSTLPELMALDLNEKVNKSLSPTQILLKRYMNPFVERTFGNTGSTFYNPVLHLIYRVINKMLNVIPTESLDYRIEKKLQDKISESVEGRYGESNERTSDLIGMDLSAFGYQMKR